MNKEKVFCKICNTEATHFEKIVVIKKYASDLFKCANCEFIFLDNPHWLDEVYKEPIHKTDTGYVWRNLWARDEVCKILNANNINPSVPLLDFAGGYGLFVRLMRDQGYNFLWYDPFCQNLFAKGFEGDLLKTKYSVITAFEVFEHLPSPMESIKQILRASNTLIFSTEIVPQNTPKANDWWYYAFEESGQHISFYSLKTLQKIATQTDTTLVSNNKDFHILSREKIKKEKFFNNNSLIKKIIYQVFKKNKTQALAPLFMQDRQSVISEKINIKPY